MKECPTSARDELGHGRLAEEVRHLRAHRLPAAVGRAGMSVVAGGPPEQAAPFRRDRMEWLDHLKQGEPPGVRGEPEPAPLTAGGGENPLPGEAVECLREVV